MYQSKGVEKIDEIKMFSNQKFYSNHDVHRALAVTERYSTPTKRGENQFVSGVIGMSCNPFLSRGRSCVHEFRVRRIAEVLGRKNN